MGKQVAETIITQMGGFGKLKAMVAANNFITNGNDVYFKFKGSKISNYIKVTLTPLDTYKVEFGKIRGYDYKVVKELDNVYCDQLIEIFENTTGLYLTL